MAAGFSSRVLPHFGPKEYPNSILSQSKDEEFRFRGPLAQDFDAWFALYEKYAVDVKATVDRQIAGIVWGWFLDQHHPAECVLLFTEEALVGFAHFRPFPRTLNANEAGYLDDLYVCEHHRRRGLARALIEHVSKVGDARGWSHLRWVAFEDNRRARRLYEEIAERSDLLTYIMPTCSRL